MVTINHVPVYATEFAWDGCHKIYLIHTDEDKAQLLDYGYTLFPIAELPEVWESSCSMRFISNADLEYSPVEQFMKAEVALV